MTAAASSEARRRSHGSWPRAARVAARLKTVVREELAAREAGALDPARAEALEMILVKIARIVSGDALFPDHWLAIAAYADLARAAPWPGDARGER